MMLLSDRVAQQPTLHASAPCRCRGVPRLARSRAPSLPAAAGVSVAAVGRRAHRAGRGGGAAAPRAGAAQARGGGGAAAGRAPRGRGGAAGGAQARHHRPAGERRPFGRARRTRPPDGTGPAVSHASHLNRIRSNLLPVFCRSSCWTRCSRPRRPRPPPPARPRPPTPPPSRTAPPRPPSGGGGRARPPATRHRTGSSSRRPRRSFRLPQSCPWCRGYGSPSARGSAGSRPAGPGACCRAAAAAT